MSAARPSGKERRFPILGGGPRVVEEKTHQFKMAFLQEAVMRADQGLGFRNTRPNLRDLIKADATHFGQVQSMRLPSHSSISRPLSHELRMMNLTEGLKK